MKIIHLPKAQWKGAVVPIGYTTEEHYALRARQRADGFDVAFERQRFPAPVTHTPEEHDFPDRLYADHWPEAFAWGVVEDGALRAAIETCPEEWSNRLRVTELWVDERLRGRGVGRALMALAKEQARRERRRAVILETQSCNVNAIGFYVHEGFSLIGFDRCAYSNNDPARGEVRMELGFLRARPAPLTADALTIRPERPEDFRAAEEMARRAFWNKHHLGCAEHLLVRRLRDERAYVPELTRVAVLEGAVVGAIYYARAALVRDGETREILTFGPLCVDPAQQGRGVGALLLRETLPEAKRMGFPGVVIFGEPDYYPRQGFSTCDRFGVTTADGKNFGAFMGLELTPGGLSGFGGAFHEPAVYENLTPEDVDAFDRDFPPLLKQRFPGQWD